MIGRLLRPLMRRHINARRDLFGGLALPESQVVFLGDSITEGGLWNEWFPLHPTLNRGIAGDTVEGVRSRLSSAVNHPAAISLLIGTNDLNGQGRTRSVAGIAAQFDELAHHIRALAPDTPLIVNSVMPRSAKFAARIRELNRRYAETARAVDATYLDLWPALADGDALRADCTWDGLHLNGHGYRTWVEVLRPCFEAVPSGAGSVDHRAHDLAGTRRQFLLAHGRGDDTWADGVDAGTALAPVPARGLDPQVVGPLGDAVRGPGVDDPVRAEKRQPQQLVGGRAGQRGLEELADERLDEGGRPGAGRRDRPGGRATARPERRRQRTRTTCTDVTATQEVEMPINRTAMIDYVDARIARTDNPKHLDQLKVLRAHMLGEITQDVDELLATISPHHQQYRSWGAPEDMQPASREEIREFYLERAALGQLYFQFDIDRLTVADDVIITDGVMTSLYPGSTVVGMGLPTDRPEAVHEVTIQSLISWPFDETGLLVGEESYSVVTGARPVADAEVPADFPAALVS